MWIKTPDSITFPNRLGVAVISNIDFINCNLPQNMMVYFAEIRPDEQYHLKLLSRFYDNTDKWQLYILKYDIIKRQLEYIISSPDFAEIPIGEEAPYIERKPCPTTDTTNSTQTINQRNEK